MAKHCFSFLICWCFTFPATLAYYLGQQAAKDMANIIFSIWSVFSFKGSLGRRKYWRVFGKPAEEPEKQTKGF